MNQGHKLIARVANRYLKRSWGGFPTMPRDSYLPKEVRGQKPLIPQGTDLVIYTWESPNGKPMGIAFQGKAQKPLWHYSFRSEESRQKTIDETINSRKKTLAEKTKRLEERKQFQHGLKEGDILYSSWGYDQTNVDFYQVTKVIGKMVEIRQVAQKVVREERGADYVVAVPNRFVGKPMKKKPSGGGGHVYISLNSFSSAYPWDGKPKYETAAGWGH